MELMFRLEIGRAMREKRKNKLPPNDLRPVSFSRLILAWAHKLNGPLIPRERLRQPDTIQWNVSLFLAGWLLGSQHIAVKLMSGRWAIYAPSRQAKSNAISEWMVRWWFLPAVKWAVNLSPFINITSSLFARFRAVEQTHVCEWNGPAAIRKIYVVYPCLFICFLFSRLYYVYRYFFFILSFHFRFGQFVLIIFWLWIILLSMNLLLRFMIDCLYCGDLKLPEITLIWIQSKDVENAIGLITPHKHMHMNRVEYCSIIFDLMNSCTGFHDFPLNAVW